VGRWEGAVVRLKFRRHKKIDLSSCHLHALNPQLLSAWTWTKPTPDPDAFHMSEDDSSIYQREGVLPLRKDEWFVRVRSCQVRKSHVAIYRYHRASSSDPGPKRNVKPSIIQHHVDEKKYSTMMHQSPYKQTCVPLFFFKILLLSASG